MAHKKAASSSDNGRDSASKRLGVKLFGGQTARAGNIIIRQRGTKFHPGINTYLGKDFTLHAKVDGIVSFQKRKFNRTFVNITPFEVVEETVAKVAPKKSTPKKKTPKAETAKTEPLTAVAEIETPVVEAPVVKKPKKAKPAKEVSKKETAKATPKPKKKKAVKQDDLKIIEGVGPKIEGLLKDGGFDTWAKVAAATPEQIKEILAAAGPRYKMHNPTTWPKQAELADQGKFDELKTWQDELDGGK